MSEVERARRLPDPAPVFAALGDPTRLRLIRRLGDGRQRSIVQLCDGFDVSRQAVTKHLRMLQRAGLVRGEHVGRENRYSLVPERLAWAREFLDAVGAQWEAALTRLESHLEE